MGLGLRAAKVRFFGIFSAVLLSSWHVGAGESVSMVAGRQTSQPIGHYEFCKVSPAECTIRPWDRGPLHLTPELMERLSAINMTVNRSVRPLNDIDIYGRDEVWAYPDVGSGDCEDYALQKRRELNTAGISLANLLITVVRKPDGEGHAVLTVRTDSGDLILDNLNDEVRGWRDTGYRFLKRQASYHTGRWVSLRNEDATLVGSVSN
jgi:predicted transglutaminase-like cysteine proteinase